MLGPELEEEKSVVIPTTGCEAGSMHVELVLQDMGIDGNRHP